jgi:hypothetical protein
MPLDLDDSQQLLPPLLAHAQPSLKLALEQSAAHTRPDNTIRHNNTGVILIVNIKAGE